MTRRSPYVIELTDEDRAVLQARTRAYTAPYHEVVRAKIVLLAAEGMENVAIAGRLQVSVATVALWRKRFVQQGVAGLAERKRSGRPRTFPPSGAGGGGGAGLRAANPRVAGGPGAGGAAGRAGHG